jgi:hypothetical protein
LEEEERKRKRKEKEEEFSSKDIILTFNRDSG